MGYSWVGRTGQGVTTVLAATTITQTEARARAKLKKRLENMVAVKRLSDAEREKFTLWWKRK